MIATIDAHPLGRGALVLAVALLLFAAALLAGDDSEQIPTDTSATPDQPTATVSPPATATATATPAPTTTPEPTPTPRPGPEPAFGELPPALRVSEGSTWVREDLAPGEDPGSDHGVLIHDLATGASEHWSLSDGLSSGAEFFAYGIAGDGRFATFGDPIGPAILVDRDTANELAWDTREMRFLGGSADGKLLLATVESEDGTCLYWAVDVASGQPEPLLRFGLDGDRSCVGHAVFNPLQPDSLLLNVNDREAGDATTYAVDLSAGTIEVAGAARSYTTLVPDGDGTYWIRPFGDPERDETVGFDYHRYDWAVGGATTRRFEATANGERVGLALPSPDGRLIAWQEALRLGQDFGIGGYFDWPVVVIADIESREPIARVLRAALTDGEATAGWLADSSGLWVATEDGAALLAIHGDPSEGAPTIRGRTNVPLVPSPDNGALLASSGRFVDLDGNEVLPPMATGWARPGPLHEGWTAGGDEYYIAVFDRGATDGGPVAVAPFGLPERIELPPLSNELRLVVTEPTDLRASADGEAATTWAVEIGTVVVVENDGSAVCRHNFGCASRVIGGPPDQRNWRIFVRTEDGRAGWADAAVLDWAP